MPIKDQIMRMAAGNPQVERAVNGIMAQLRNTPMVPEDLTQAIKMLELVLQHPDRYQQVRQAAIADRLIDPNMIPPQFDKTFVVSLLIALYAMQDKLSQRMAKGGLVEAARRVAAAGRGGDTELVHVNKREEEMLRRVGGAGTVNPNTGLREYKGGFLGSILSVAVPIVSNLIAPGIGELIGSNILAGAALGAAGSAITGGNALQGAVMGGLGQGLGETVGKQLGFEGTQANLVGSGLVGGAVGAATCQGFGKGLASGLAGGALGNLASSAGTGSALGAGVGAAGRAAGSALTAGYSPAQAGLMGVSSGILGGLKYKPSEAVVGSLKPEVSGDVSKVDLSQVPAGAPQLGERYFDDQGQPMVIVQNQQTGILEGVADKGGKWTWDAATQSPKYTYAADIQAPQQQPGALRQLTNAMGVTSGTADKGLLGTGISPTTAAIGLAALSSLSSASPQVQNEVGKLSAAQQEYVNRPSITWNWGKMQQDAAANNMSLSQYMAQNWNRVTSGAYNNPVVARARGGVLNSIAGYAQGSGTGRSDSIDAKLSDGEYVMDAETVSMLGDGSNKAGAQKLDQMRAEIRKQKGKALAKGKISPDARSPLAYIKEMR